MISLCLLSDTYVYKIYTKLSFYEKYKLFNQLDYQLIIKILLSSNISDEFINNEVGLMKEILTKNLVYLTFSKFNILGIVEEMEA